MQQNSPAGPPGGDNPPMGPAGAVINYADVSVRGGDGAIGGAGGAVLLETQLQIYFDASFEIATNFGVIDATGGSSSDDNAIGGEAGNIQLLGMSGVQNAAAANADGGDASGASSTGGAGNEVIFTADYGTAQNTGTLSSSGGNGTGTAGNGGNADEILMNGVGLSGPGIVNTAALTCSGGNGANLGGNGGAINLFTSFGTETSNSGTLTAAAGTGNTNGSAGSINVDGANVGP